MRKKWGFRLNDETEIHSGFGSESAVYDAVREEAEHWVTGEIRVYVDERSGFGWQLFECLDLAELAVSRIDS